MSTTTTTMEEKDSGYTTLMCAPFHIFSQQMHNPIHRPRLKMSTLQPLRDSAQEEMAAPAPDLPPQISSAQQAAAPKAVGISECLRWGSHVGVPLLGAPIEKGGCRHFRPPVAGLRLPVDLEVDLLHEETGCGVAPPTAGPWNSS